MLPVSHGKNALSSRQNPIITEDKKVAVNKKNQLPQGRRIDMLSPICLKAKPKS